MGHFMHLGRWFFDNFFKDKHGWNVTMRDIMINVEPKFYNKIRTTSFPTIVNSFLLFMNSSTHMTKM